MQNEGCLGVLLRNTTDTQKIILYLQIEFFQNAGARMHVNESRTDQSPKELCLNLLDYFCWLGKRLKFLESDWDGPLDRIRNGSKYKLTEEGSSKTDSSSV